MQERSVYMKLSYLSYHPYRAFWFIYIKLGLLNAPFTLEFMHENETNSKPTILVEKLGRQCWISHLYQSSDQVNNDKT
jgi:hypothetical protein